MLLTFEGDKTLLTLHDSAVNWKVILSESFDYILLEVGPKPLEKDRLEYLLKTLSEQSANNLIVYSPFLKSKQIINALPELKKWFNSIILIVHQDLRGDIDNDLVITVIDQVNHNEAIRQALLLVSSTPLTDEEHQLFDHNDDPDSMKIFKAVKDNSEMIDQPEKADEYY